MDRHTDDFAAFVADCEQQLRGTALLLTGDPAQADDLVVAALARTHRRWRRLDSPSAALAATRATLVSAALGHTRLSATGSTIQGSTIHGITIQGSGGPADRPDGDQLDAGDRRWLEALSGLGPTTRAVVVLRLVDGEDEESVAALLGRSPQVVADALAAAVQTLEPLLADEPRAEPDAQRPPAPPPSALPRPEDGDLEAVFRRPDGPTPPPPPAPAARAVPAPAPGPTPEDDDDPYAIYRRPR